MGHCRVGFPLLPITIDFIYFTLIYQSRIRDSLKNKHVDLLLPYCQPPCSYIYIYIYKQSNVNLYQLYVIIFQHVYHKQQMRIIGSKLDLG